MVPSYENNFKYVTKFEYTYNQYVYWWVHRYMKVKCVWHNNIYYYKLRFSGNLNQNIYYEICLFVYSVVAYSLKLNHIIYIVYIPYMKIEMNNFSKNGLVRSINKNIE